MRAASVTWLIATMASASALATIGLYLSLSGYFAAAALDDFSLERPETTASIILVVAGHLVPRVHRRAPRCHHVSTIFHEALTYRAPPQVTRACGAPAICRERADAALHARVAIGVSSSLAIAAIGFRAVMHHLDLGGTSCMSSPISYGGNILLYFVLAMVTVLSHGPALRLSRVSSSEHAQA